MEPNTSPRAATYSYGIHAKHACLNPESTSPVRNLSFPHYTFNNLLPAPDQLLMTGSTGDKCGIGEAAFKVEILDESVVEYGGHPPDALGGVETFSGAGSEGAVCVAGGEAGGDATAAAAATGLGTGVPAVTSDSVATAPLVSTPAVASTIAASSVVAAPIQPVVSSSSSVPPIGAVTSPATRLSAASTSAQVQVAAASASARTWGGGRGGRRPPRSFR